MTQATDPTDSQSIDGKQDPRVSYDSDSTTQTTKLEKQIDEIVPRCGEDDCRTCPVRHIELAKLIQSEATRIEKAYGGCHNCYGKGYATTMDGVIGYDDFGGEGFKSPITTKIKFCTCDRGKALASLTAPEGGKHD